MFSADFRTDQAEKFRQQDSGQQQCEDPWVDARKIVGGEASSAGRPEQRFASGLEEIQNDVRGSRGEGGGQNCTQRNGLWFVEIKGYGSSDGRDDRGSPERNASRCDAPRDKRQGRRTRSN